MSIHKVAGTPNCWEIRVRTRFNGKIVSKKHRRVRGSFTDAKRSEVRLRDTLEHCKDRSSLKVEIKTFGEALSYYREHSDADLRRVLTYFNKLERDLGPVQLQSLTDRFAKYLQLLKRERAKRSGEILSNATRNRLLMYAKVSLNFCIKRGLLESNPLACFDKLPEQGRDRILTEEETAKILEVMQQRKSYLYWPFYFSLKNPIRRGDLEKLTRDNLNWFKPWVHFYPSKTEKRKDRETCLPFLDKPLLEYFKSLPSNCNLLFPDWSIRMETLILWVILRSTGIQSSLQRKWKVSDGTISSIARLLGFWILDIRNGT